MKRKMITITLMALLVLLLSVGGVSGQGPEPEGDVELEEAVSAATVPHQLPGPAHRGRQPGNRPPGYDFPPLF